MTIKEMLQDITSQLTGVGSQRCCYHIVLQAGKPMAVQEFTPEELQLIAEVREYCGPFISKQCWKNSQMVAAIFPQFEYAEGYISITEFPFPIHHAWVLLNDKVVELTLDAPAEGGYFGVKISTDLIVQYWEDSAQYGPLTDDFELGYKYAPRILMTPKERAALRPANYETLPTSEQWRIDKRLGILDWDGK